MTKRDRQPAAVPLDTGEPVSKSERKRRAHRLQALGRRLTELRAEELAGLPLPERVRTAVADYQRFSAHEARRRQLQFIGRLMREVDADPLQEALDGLDGASAESRYEFHQLERWRERLLEDPDALTTFVAEHPHVDVQQLRQRINQVHQAASEDRQRAASRALFRFLRDSAHPA